MKTNSMRVRVSGLVQGVGYRYFAVQKARLYGVRGWVRNQVNGDVEVLAQGDQEAVRSLLADLRVGPRSAQVTSLRIDHSVDEDSCNDFEVR